MFLKQSTAVTIRFGPFVDNTDGFTAETALTITQADVRLSKAHAAFAQKGDASSATHEENGWYQVPLSTTDTGTLGRLIVAVNETGALPVWVEFTVLPANIFDSLVAGTDKLQTDLAEWLGSVPNALVSSRVDASVGAVAAAAITAAAIATDAIDADAMADGAITSGVFAAGAINAAAIATDAIDADAIAAGAIDAAAFAADAITAAKVAADVSAEIADAVWDELKADHTVADSFGDYLDDEITTRATAADVPTAAVVADAVWDELKSGHTTADSFGDYLDDEVSSRAAPGDAMDLVANAIDAAAIATDAIDADAIAAGAIDAAAFAADAITAAKVAADVSAEIADAVWDELKAGHTVADSFGDYLDTEVSGVGGGTPPTAAEVADAVWDELKAGHTVADSFGDYLDDEITSRAVAGDVPSAGVVADAVWDELKAGHTVADSFGDYLDDEVSSRAAPGAEMDLIADAITAGKIATDAIGSSEISSAGANKIADHTLRRSFANARGSSNGDTLSFRSLLGAVAKLVNRWSISGTTLTVYREDDTTALGTPTLTATPGVDPVTEIDTD